MAKAAISMDIVGASELNVQENELCCPKSPDIRNKSVFRVSNPAEDL
jgi:hypothetical protein